MHVDILAIGVHPDDVELSCAGTLISHIEQGHQVGLLDLTRGELGTRGSADLRDEEAAASAEIMGVGFRQNLALADGFFRNTEEAQRRIIEIIRYCKPKLVLANALSDRHPDHGRAAKLIADACYLSGLSKIKTSYSGAEQQAHRPANLLHYVQDYYRKPDFVVDITDQIERKIECVKAFKSQFHDPESDEPDTPLTGEDFFPFLYARAREFGRPAGYKYAEGFEYSRLVGIQNLLDLH